MNRAPVAAQTGRDGIRQTARTGRSKSPRGRRIDALERRRSICTSSAPSAEAPAAAAGRPSHHHRAAASGNALGLEGVADNLEVAAPITAHLGVAPRVRCAASAKGVGMSGAAARCVERPGSARRRPRRSSAAPLRVRPLASPAAAARAAARRDERVQVAGAAPRRRPLPRSRLGVGAHRPAASRVEMSRPRRSAEPPPAADRADSRPPPALKLPPSIAVGGAPTTRARRRARVAGRARRRATRRALSLAAKRRRDARSHANAARALEEVRCCEGTTEQPGGARRADGLAHGDMPAHVPRPFLRPPQRRE